MQGKAEKKQQKYKRQPGGSSMAVFPFLYSVRIFFRLLLCSAGSAECSFPIKHIPLRVRKLCFRFDVSRKFPGTGCSFAHSLGFHTAPEEL